MQLIPLSTISVRTRQRVSIAPGPLNELKESILLHGLLHPPVVWFEDGKAVLSVGERRLRAIELLAKEKKSFHCDGQTVPPGQVPVLTLAEFLDEAGRFGAELDENLHRVNLSWQEQNKALADLHRLRQKQRPGQTVSDTAKELVARQTGVVQSSGRTTGAADVTRKKVEAAVTIAAHLHNPKIAKARNAEEALGLIYKQEEERLRAALVRRRLAVAPSKQDIEIRHADALSLLPQLDADTVDLIIADPPYGIEAASGGFRSRTIHHHNYDDSMETARTLALAILTDGFRITKARANLFLFCDSDLFHWLRDAAANMGWVPFRTPIIWQKSESEGLAPWGSSGFRRTYEMILYATKGQRGLISSPVDILTIKRVSRHERLFAAEKPVELLRTLIGASTLPGDLVLDPCCGSGSTLVACKELRRRGLGIEKDLDTYNTALANALGGDDDGKEGTSRPDPDLSSRE